MDARTITSERAALALLDEALEREPESPAGYIGRQEEIPHAIRERASRLLAAHFEAAASFRTGGARANLQSDPPDRVGSYRILRCLGRGGMGAVYLGERISGDFEHAVAIKLIHSGLFSDELAERFRRERQILATLNHPHIARLYDGGESENGEPYIVMEYVDGQPLEQWLESERPAFGRRLELFEQICGAVQFAHQNLIIHRDLTPANVLVTEEGAPKLIDFGIAKPQDDKGNAEAATGGALEGLSLTPGFAAPERIAGAPATTLTDIYSLGKLLDHLIADWKDDPDIAAIIGQAMADAPEARYPTADALAEDIENFHAGYPVEARNGGRRYKIGKFASRNRMPVIAGIGALLLLIGAFAVTLYAYTEAEEARIAERARFDEVRALANTLLFDVYDAVDAVPGSTAAREMLASTAQSYLDALAQDEDAPFDIRLEAGRGYMRLADVMGGVGGGNLGLRDEAMRNYERADAILTRLHEEAPANEEAAIALAELRRTRANTMVHIAEDMDRGLVFARSVQGILDRECADADRCALVRAQGFTAEGQNLHWLERFEEAVAAYDRALAQIATLDAAARRAEDVIRAEALGHRLKGDTLYYLDDVEGSVRELGIASRILSAAIDRGRNDPDIARDLAIVEWSRGGSLDEAGRPEEGVQALNTAYTIMQEQVAADSDDLGSLRLLAIVGGQRALTLSSAGRYRAAAETANASLTIRRRLSRMQPEEAGYFRDVAIMLAALGDIHNRAGDAARACQTYREALAQFDAFDRRWEMSDFDRGDTYAQIRVALQNC